MYYKNEFWKFGKFFWCSKISSSSPTNQNFNPMRMKILILLLVVGIFSQNCTISIAPNSIEDIKKGYTRAAYMKISIKSNFIF